VRERLLLRVQLRAPDMCHAVIMVTSQWHITLRSAVSFQSITHDTLHGDDLGRSASSGICITARYGTVQYSTVRCRIILQWHRKTQSITHAAAWLVWSFRFVRPSSFRFASAAALSLSCARAPVEKSRDREEEEQGVRTMCHDVSQKNLAF